MPADNRHNKRRMLGALCTTLTRLAACGPGVPSHKTGVSPRRHRGPSRPKAKRTSVEDDELLGDDVAESDSEAGAGDDDAGMHLDGHERLKQMA